MNILDSTGTNLPANASITTSARGSALSLTKSYTHSGHVNVSTRVSFDLSIQTGPLTRKLENQMKRVVKLPSTGLMTGEFALGRNIYRTVCVQMATGTNSRVTASLRYSACFGAATEKIWIRRKDAFAWTKRKLSRLTTLPGQMSTISQLLN